jgi:hypothetical protein
MVETSSNMCGGDGDVIAVLQSLYISLLIEAGCTSRSGASDVIIVMYAVISSIMAKARRMVCRRVGVVL